MLCDVLGRRCARPEFRGHCLLLGRLEQRIHQEGGGNVLVESRWALTSLSPKHCGRLELTGFEVLLGLRFES